MRTLCFSVEDDVGSQGYFASGKFDVGRMPALLADSNLEFFRQVSGGNRRLPGRMVLREDQFDFVVSRLGCLQ